MKLAIHVTLTFLIVSVAIVRSSSDVENNYDNLDSEAARQKIYEIISSHEDRKFGDHGGHEYEEGEIPKKAGSQKYKRYGYEPSGANYYYLDQPKQPKPIYLPKAPIAEKHYVDPVYTAQNGPYPVVESSYVEPKKSYLAHDSPYALPKRPESLYLVPKRPKEHIYRESVGDYLEDKTAPITIGKTARTVYPKNLGRSGYPIVDANHPSEYVVLEGQKPPRPLILDPKLKESYHHSQPTAHYSTPEHQVILKPENSVAYRYPIPVKKHQHYDDHHQIEEKGHHAAGHEYHDENAVKKETGHKSHGHHDVGGHKAHSSVVAKHDEHGHHHNRGLYERDRGYHYEKAYAYDRIRAHHDIGSTGAAQSTYGAHHGQEAHKNAGNHGAETYSYFKKDDHGSGYGYNNGNSLHKKGHGYYDHKNIPTYYYG